MKKAKKYNLSHHLRYRRSTETSEVASSNDGRLSADKFPIPTTAIKKDLRSILVLDVAFLAAFIGLFLLSLKVDVVTRVSKIFGL